MTKQPKPSQEQIEAAKDLIDRYRQRQSWENPDTVAMIASVFSEREAALTERLAEAIRLHSSLIKDYQEEVVLRESAEARCAALRATLEAMLRVCVRNDGLDMRDFRAALQSVPARVQAAAKVEEVPEVVSRALKQMHSDRMAIGHMETEVFKCCENEPKDGHAPECLVSHALAALEAAKSPEKKT